MEQLAKHFKKVAGAALTRNGFAFADLLSSWPEIAGAELAPHCVPEKLSRGGQLVLKARFGRALEVQYAGPVLIERINRFCGFAAVSSLKVLQGPLPEPRKSPKPAPRLAPEAEAALAEKLTRIEDPRLKAALARIGAQALKNR